MKKILLLISILVLPSIVKGYEVKVTDGKVIANKWELKGVPIWTDEDKKWIIDNSSTGITDADFVLAVTPEDQAIIDSIDKAGSHTDALNEIEKRKSPDYQIDTLVKEQQKLDALQKIQTDKGIDLSVQIQESQAKLDAQTQSVQTTQGVQTNTTTAP